MIDIAKRAMAHTKHLCVEIGHRPAGSPGNDQAAEYVESVFRDVGLIVERQEFACTSWEHAGTALELASCRLEATANWRSLPCDIMGTLVPVGTLDVLAQVDLTGCVALLYGELTQDEISNRASPVYYPERHQRINELLDQKMPAAVIAVSPFLRSTRHVIKDPDMPIPSATVSAKVGLQLIRHAGERLRLRIAARRSVGRSCNVVGTRPGARSERVVICAHYDTVWGSPGAFDNASGVGVMLTLAEVLARRELPLGLEFVAFSAEEFGGQGTDVYLQSYGLKQVIVHWDQPPGGRSAVWRPIVAAINVDGVGLELGANTITTIVASRALEQMVNAIRGKAYPGVVRVDPWPASDHYTFYSHGVPSIALGSTGGVSDLHHRPIDTVRWISPAKLGEAVSLALDVVDALQDKTAAWCRSDDD